ncbi:MAG: SoxR reducing system RseC family protein [Pseudomonadales bacterium]
MLSTTARVIRHSAKRVSQFASRSPSSKIALNDQAVTHVQISPIGCAGCSSRCQEQTVIEIPGSYTEDLELMLSTEDQLILLLHSLLLPLAGFILGASIGQWMGWHEIAVLGCALLVMLLSVFMCKQQAYSKIKILEVN